MSLSMQPAPHPATSTSLRRPGTWRGFFLKIGLMLVILLALLEVMLRVQQKIGPYYDLEMKDVSLTTLSDEVNHTSNRDNILYDDLGLKIYQGMIPAEALAANTPKVLYLGDSFMQGYVGTKDDIAWHVWNLSQAAGKPLLPVNAGCASYSPALFIPLARKLLPVVKPRYIIVDIDHTDLVDDSFRYDALSERDANGQIVRVKVTPANKYHTESLIAARSYPLYLLRAIHKTYALRWGFRQIDQGRADQIKQQVANFVESSPEQIVGKYQQETALFERNLRDLADVLIAGAGSPTAVLWVCHPHPHHLGPVDGEPRHHRLVFETVSKIAREKGINYYDATPDLARAFAGKYADYYLPGDKIYHFNPAGLKIYAQSIYDHLPAAWKQ